MKIGIFISPRHTVPPDEDKILAPWYLAEDLADGLTTRKYKTYLFAAKHSKTKAILCHFDIEPTYKERNKFNQEQYTAYKKKMDQILFMHALETARKESIDIIHTQQLEDMYELIKNESGRVQFVFTLHDPINEVKQSLLAELDSLPNCHFTAVSDSQRHNLPYRFTDTVYNGIRINDYEFTEEPSDYLLHMGRLVPEKGLYTAIAASLKLNMQLEIGTDLNDTGQNEYFQSKIKPYIKSKYIGEPGIVMGQEKIRLYRQAKALLFPIEWEEPFGLVMTEAMACGTPVIGFARGSLPEVVVDGITGFIVNQSPEYKRGNWIIQKTGVDGIIEAIERLNAMDGRGYKSMRNACRKHVEENFTVDIMVDNYEKIYRRILGMGK